MEGAEPEYKYCSNCKKDIASAVFLLHENHCRRHIVLCDTCGEPVPRTMMEEHMTEHEEIPCDQCRSPVERENMEAHLADECPLRMIVCPYCQLEVKANEFDEHSDPCGSRTDVCDNCNQRVMLKFMEEHHRDYCGKSLPEPSSHRHRLLPTQPPQAPAYHDLYPPQRDSHAPAVAVTPLHPYHDPPPYYPDDQPARDEGSSQQPSETRAELSPPSLHNPTMIIDPDWLGSVADAVGEKNLDSMLAQTMSYETSRHQIRNDQQMLEEESKKQQETDEEMARRLQRNYDIHASYTAHDATLAQQLQGEDAPVSPHQDALSEQYARQLQEQEDQNVVRLSGEQFDERQRRLAEQRRQVQTDEQRGEYDQQTEERLDDVRKQILAHRKRKEDEELRREEDDVRRRNEARYTDELAHHRPSYRLDPSEDDDEEQWQHQQQASGSYYHGTGSKSASEDEMDVEVEGRRMQHNTAMAEDRNKNYDEITDIPCDLCGAAVPFEDYNRHLTEEHRRDKSDPYHAPIQHYHQDYAPAHNFYRRRSPSPSSPSPSPPTNSADNSLSPERPSQDPQYDYVQCRHCHEHFSVSIVSGHEVICDDNPDKHLKDAKPTRLRDLQPRPSTPPLLQSRLPVDHPFVETELPCEFCEQSFPISVFADHQEMCTKRYTRRQPYAAASYYTPLSGTGRTRSEEEDDLDVQIPCEHCYKLIPRSMLTRHQAICSIRSSTAATASSRVPATAKPVRPALHDLQTSSQPLESARPLLHTYQPLLVPITSRSSPTSSDDVSRPGAPSQLPYGHVSQPLAPSEPTPPLHPTPLLHPSPPLHSTPPLHLTPPLHPSPASDSQSTQNRILPHRKNGAPSGAGLPSSGAVKKSTTPKIQRKVKLAANFGKSGNSSSITLTPPTVPPSSTGAASGQQVSNPVQSFFQNDLPAAFVQRQPGHSATASHQKAVHSDPTLSTRSAAALPTLSRSAFTGASVQTDSVTKNPRTLTSQSVTSGRPKNRTQLLQTLPRENVHTPTLGEAQRGNARSLVSSSDRYGYGGTRRADQSRPGHASGSSSQTRSSSSKRS